jgi:hypothetical protein
MNALASRLRRRPRTHTNPVFYRARVEALLADQPERLERLVTDTRSVDLLTWNVLASLARHPDREWLAHRLQMFGGTRLRAPARVALWTGRDREPRLEPTPGYLAAIRQRAADAAGDDDSLAAFAAPIEVPVRIESPEVLCLVDTTLDAYPRGAGGRDRVLELVDAGLEHARRLGKHLAVAVVYASGTQGAREVSARMQALRDRTALAAELAHRQHVPEVILREVTWQQLLATWRQEVGYLPLGGQPVRAFRDHAAELGLR